MDFVEIFLPVLVALGLPILVYILRVRPRMERSMLPVLIIGALMSVCMFLPLASMAGFFMLYIWGAALTVLLIIHAVIWIVAAVKKKPCCTGGAVMTGITVFCSSLLFGNIVALLAAAFYLAMLVRYRYAW